MSHDDHISRSACGRLTDACWDCAAAQDLKARHREVMQEVLMDVLRALSSPNMDIRKKTLDIALDLITARNIDEVRSRRALDGERGADDVQSASSPPRLIHTGIFQ